MRVICEGPEGSLMDGGRRNLQIKKVLIQRKYQERYFLEKEDDENERMKMKLSFKKMKVLRDKELECIKIIKMPSLFIRRVN